MNKKIYLLSFLFLTDLAASAAAKSDCYPTPQKKLAIDKVVHVVAPVIVQFGDNNWEIVSGGPDASQYYSVQVKPVVPIGVAPFNDGENTVRQGSPLWNTAPIQSVKMLQSSPAHNQRAVDAYNELAKRI